MSAPFLGNYIAGKFLKSREVSGHWISQSPADLDDAWSEDDARIVYSFADIDTALEAARSAFQTWRKKTIAERAEALKRYQTALKKNEEAIVRCISREVGKPLWESKTEFTAMVNKVDVTINESMKLVQDFEIASVLPNTHGVCKYKPLGVMAVVGPFNFPGHLPNGHIVPALLTGNTVVFKPSEKTPLVGQWIAQCFHEAGIPAGVFNLLQGEREVSRRLCLHEGVDGVLFTGSYEVGLRLKQDTLSQHWKLLALEMGGKNASIVWKDADLENAIHEVLVSAYLTAGQRCSATSRVIVHESLLGQFVSSLHAKAKTFKIGHPEDSPFMGPLIDASSVDRYMKFLGTASREGAELVMRGKALELSKKGHYVTPSICLFSNSSIESVKKSVFQQTELFAPAVSVVGTSDLDHAIALGNATQFGLVASVFSADRAIYQRCFDDLQVGLVNWNRGTVGASSRLPFGGLKKSGNHFPTALSAPLYCTSPISALEVAEPGTPQAYPGLS